MGLGKATTLPTDFGVVRTTNGPLLQVPEADWKEQVLMPRAPPQFGGARAAPCFYGLNFPKPGPTGL